VNHIKLFTLAFLITLLAISCSDNNTNVTAEKMSMNQLSETPGFSWVYVEMERYTPNDSVIQEIMKAYDPAVHSFILFAKPSCSCPGKQLHTPYFFKTLEAANIPVDKCEIFTMSSLTNNQPYSEIITLTDLPTIVVMKGDVPVFTITDEISNVSSTNQNTGLSVESALLSGLEK
jgi:hypothetical protein